MADASVGAASGQKRGREDDGSSGGAADKSLLQELECPVCMAYIALPFEQCANGHLICGPCKPSLSGKCPTCRVSISSKLPRCLMMEKVAATLNVPCEFDCGANVLYTKMREHEAVCPKAPLPCPCAPPAPAAAMWPDSEHRLRHAGHNGNAPMMPLVTGSQLTLRKRCEFKGSAEELSAHIISAHSRTERKLKQGKNVNRLGNNWDGVSTRAKGSNWDEVVRVGDDLAVHIMFGVYPNGMLVLPTLLSRDYEGAFTVKISDHVSPSPNPVARMTRARTRSIAHSSIHLPHPLRLRPASASTAPRARCCSPARSVPGSRLRSSLRSSTTTPSSRCQRCSGASHATTSPRRAQPEGKARVSTWSPSSLTSIRSGARRRTRRSRRRSRRSARRRRTGGTTLQRMSRAARSAALLLVKRVAPRISARSGPGACRKRALTSSSHSELAQAALRE